MGINIFEMGALLMTELSNPDNHKIISVVITIFPDAIEFIPNETKFNIPVKSIASDMNKMQKR